MRTQPARRFDGTESALEIPGMAWEGYQKAMGDLRDKDAETRGESGDAAARDAEAALAKALASKVRDGR